MTTLSSNRLSWRDFFSPWLVFGIPAAPSPLKMNEDIANPGISAFPREDLQLLRENYFLERRFFL